MSATSVERTVTLHGHAFSYTDSGSGPVLLFIHGLLGSQKQWAHLVDRLDEDHRLIVPDLFGHGESAKPVGDYSLGAHAATLRDLLDRLGIEQVTPRRPLARRRHRDGCSPTCSPSGSTGWSWSPAGASAGRSARCCGRRPCPGAEYVLPVIASGWMRDRVSLCRTGCSARWGTAGPRPDARSGTGSPRSATPTRVAPSWRPPGPSSTPAGRPSTRTTTCRMRRPSRR